MFHHFDAALIKELKTAGDGPNVLSVYLPIRPGLNFPQSYNAELLSLLGDLKTATPQAEHAALETESQRVLAYVRDQYTPNGRSLALFSSSPRGLLSAIQLPLAMPPLARFLPSTFMGPLESVIDDNPRMAIVCADERESMVIVTFLGEAESEQVHRDDIPPRQRQGGWAAFKYDRDRVHHINEHFHDVAHRLEEIYQQTPFSRIVIGGSQEAANVITSALSSQLQPLVAGSFRVEMFDSVTNLIANARPVAEAAERDEDLKLAHEIKDKALSRGAASLGWDETLQLLAQGQVHLLAIPTSKLGSPEADQALTRAWESGAKVEFIGAEAEAVLSDAGGVGSLLRY